MANDYRICSRGVWDSTVPGITFDENGVSNYADMFDKLTQAYPRGEKGKRNWENIVDNIKARGKGRRYDCVIGVSGGTDSSYLLHVARKEYGLRPLAVNLDNGWNSEIAVWNIKKLTKDLDIDLETYVIEYGEIKDLLRAYMRAALPWIDIPTDLAIKAVLFRVAAKERVKYILRANDFRSEGTQPREWSYGDGRQLAYIHKKFGSVKLKSFPNYTLGNLASNTVVRKIRSYFPLYYLEYNKNMAQSVLTQDYGWEYYGGHHHENLFTKFAISLWLPRKFGIDKRKITYSAQVLSGEMVREEALEALKTPPYDSESLEKEVAYVLKKLDISKDEYGRLLNNMNKYYWDYPSYYPMMRRYNRLSAFAIRQFYPYKPMSLFQIELRQ